MAVIVLVVLLLVVMPALLYLVGWGAMRYTRKAPALIGFPAPRTQPSDKPDGDTPARVKV
jgi:hypothetical protein